jgi:hypothetical protein
VYLLHRSPPHIAAHTQPACWWRTRVGSTDQQTRQQPAAAAAERQRRGEQQIEFRKGALRARSSANKISLGKYDNSVCHVVNGCCQD